MKNTFRKTALAGLTALTLGACGSKGVKEENFYGNFRGFETSVRKFHNSARIAIIAPGFEWNMLSADYNSDSSNFNNIKLARVSIDRWQKAGVFLSPLFAYANPDSLNAAYKAVLQQNRKKEKK